jgi:X-Pro dipeptidyl-peptidase
MAHAFNDWNVKPLHSVRIYEALRAQGTPAQAYYHQGGHGGSPPSAMMNKWFTRYLYGVDNGVEDDPKAWIAREGESRFNPTPYADYPNPDAEPVTLVLGPGGASAGGLTHLALPVAGVETLTDDASIEATDLAEAAASDHRLLYQTPVISQDLHISGTPSITLRMASSKPAVNLSIMLAAYAADGDVDLVTRGWADPQNRGSLRNTQPLVPGEFVDVTFDLEPDDQVIPAGSRLGLVIFASDHDFTVRPEPGTQLSVDLAASWLELPVVGGPLGTAICAAEDPLDTVVVGGANSRVDNATLAGICTINHHILDDAVWPDHAAFVDHVSGLAAQFAAEGLLDAREVTALSSAARRARCVRVETGRTTLPRACAD